MLIIDERLKINFDYSFDFKLIINYNDFVINNFDIFDLINSFDVVVNINYYKYYFNWNNVEKIKNSRIDYLNTNERYIFAIEDFDYIDRKTRYDYFFDE